jgi:hypothetical protein
MNNGTIMSMVDMNNAAPRHNVARHNSTFHRLLEVEGFDAF